MSSLTDEKMVYKEEDDDIEFSSLVIVQNFCHTFRSVLHLSYFSVADLKSSLLLMNSNQSSAELNGEEQQMLFLLAEIHYKLCKTYHGSISQDTM